jgi:hypothetical protein
MYLKDRTSGDMVEVLDTAALVDPCTGLLAGRLHAGEELQDMETFAKQDLEFPSGEALPRCWMDARYRSSAQ